ncbi:MAG TPA: isoprenylcysteine carboxylmethyltransferase family protein [Patescibacteria group bacterium]|nr:isoprenylcysteine carboxylmethyltransferase family protein [Gammaproteobacteria bacterium]HWA51483.1 isoprenylcysteine carboxylmethyltransferase family protein [Patescibacteria group bacterium]
MIQTTSEKILMRNRTLSVMISILPAIIVLFFKPDIKLLFLTSLYLFWSCLELIIENTESNLVAAQKPFDKHSRAYIILCRHFCLWSSTAYILFHTKNNENLLLLLVGFLLILCGSMLRFSAIVKLKKFFTMTLNIDDKQYLIQDGLYHYIRHPSYTGVILLFTGFPLVAGSWWLAIIILFLTSAAVFYRVKLEESLLKNLKNDDYEAYMKKTYKLIPFIY